jgi:hypothetical protein
MSKQLPGFLFHGAAMTRRPQAQRRLQRIVNVSDGQACHRHPIVDVNDTNAFIDVIAYIVFARQD